MKTGIAVVGGGPAGSTLALSLVKEHGVKASDVLLIEKATHPRDKPCAGAISNWGVNALREMGIELEVPYAPMGGVRVVRHPQASALAMPMGVVIRRDEFDASLFRRAEKEGVPAIEGEPVTTIERAENGFTIRTKTKTISAKLIAACDGAGSSVRKILGIKEPARKGHLYVTETSQLDVDEGTQKDLCDFDLAPVADGLEGYYWDFPIVMNGKRCVSRGIYHANMTPAKNVKESLARHLARRGVAMKDVELRPFSTRPFVKETQCAGDGYVLVGEAAGIDRTTGEGIAQAIIFGRVAAKYLARALESGSRDFSAYNEEIHDSVMGRHLLQSAWLAPRVYGKRSRVFQDYLLKSAYAREMAARWYEGQTLGLLNVARLALGLGAHVLA